MTLRRSMKRLGISHLQLLASIARQEKKSFFERNPSARRYYGNRFIAAALCQGAALHYLDRKTGVKDFDIHLFYRQHPTRKQLSRKVKSITRSVEGYGLRKIDFIHTVIPARALGKGIVGSLRRFLADKPTQNARYLARKAVIGLSPGRIFGKIIWSDTKESEGA